MNMEMKCVVYQCYLELILPYSTVSEQAKTCLQQQLHQAGPDVLDKNPNADVSAAEIPPPIITSSNHKLIENNLPRHTGRLKLEVKLMGCPNVWIH